MKEYYYYFYDERKDDFANNGIDGKKISDLFEYYPSKKIYHLVKPVVYYLGLGLAAFINACMFIPKKNKKVLKDRKDKKTGYFVYGNHTTWLTDAVTAPEVAFPKPCYTIANPDAISIKGAGLIVRMFGAMPTPETKKNYKDFLSEIDRLYHKGCPVAIFPEAHIWPKYNEIRDFPSVSFYYPVKYNAPCFVKTTVYQKKKNGKSKARVIFDGPFYPDHTLPRKQAEEELCERVKAQMKKRAEESYLDCRYHYIKVDSPDDVRTEIRKTN